MSRPFEPRYVISSAAANALMAIEGDRTAVGNQPMTTAAISALRESARLLSTHYSTQIEGNRLTAEEVQRVVLNQASFPNRQRDAREVHHYYRAILRVEQMVAAQDEVTERRLQELHALVMEGRGRPSVYRDGQNVIRDAATSRIVYLPPEAKDVPDLMGQLVSWTRDEATTEQLPIPVVAALAHYQYVTIHPHYDGNGRSARLLSTWLLQRHGYALHGIYSLEEYYSKNLGGYYQALSVGPSHNYYEGRAQADVSPFVDFFCLGMADAFRKVRQQVERAAAQERPAVVAEHNLLRQLDALQRGVMPLFRAQAVVRAKDIGKALGISQRRAAELCRRWVQKNFLQVEDSSKRARSYRLVPRYEALVDQP